MGYDSNKESHPKHGPSVSPLRLLVCYSALTIANRSLHFLLLPLYLRHIAPAEYGVFTAVTMAAAVITVVSNLKLDAAMRTFYFDYSRETDRLNAYLGQILSASIVFAGIVYALMLLVGDSVFRLIFAHDEVQFFPAGALALATASVGACLSPYFAYLRNSLLLRELICWELLVLIGTIGLQLVFVVVMHLGLYGILWASLIPSALALALLFAAKPHLLTRRPDWRLLVPSLEYSVPLIGLGLLYTLGTRLDRFVLERHVELETLGAYAILIGLFGLLNIVLNALDNAIRPYLHPGVGTGSTQGSESIESHQRLYLLTGLLTLSFAVFLGSNIHLVTDSDAYVSMQRWLPLCATAFVPMIFARYYSLLHDLHKRSIDLAIGVAARFGVLYLLLILLVPRFGLTGALWAIFLSEIGSAVVFGVIAKRLFGLKASWASIALQPLLFLVPLWLLGHVVAGKSNAAFGVLQLVVASSLLLASNRDVLRASFLGRKGRASPSTLMGRP